MHVLHKLLKVIVPALRPNYPLNSKLLYHPLQHPGLRFIDHRLHHLGVTADLLLSHLLNLGFTHLQTVFHKALHLIIIAICHRHYTSFHLLPKLLYLLLHLIIRLFEVFEFILHSVSLQMNGISGLRKPDIYLEHKLLDQFDRLL
jgi:hypothetical protein